MMIPLGIYRNLAFFVAGTLFNLTCLSAL